MFYAWMKSPVGDILLARDEGGLCLIQFGRGKQTRAKPREPQPDWRDSPERFESEMRQLLEYFAGHRQTFEMPLAPVGTPFQQTVWTALQSIPYGETCSYRALAESIGKPSAVRAVGAANGANPIGIVIPCHRVIGANGSLTGYGGGIENKARLLEHERRNSAETERPGQFGLPF